MTADPLPPRLSTLVLRALLPRAVRDEAAGELADLYALRLEHLGRAAATRWYRRQVLGFALRLQFASLPGGPLAGRPMDGSATTRGDTMATILADVRYGARAMFRTPGFTLIAVFTLALGIGANAAIFSVVRSVLLRPLPFPAPEQLVQLWEARSDRGFDHASFTHANFWDVRDMNRSLRDVGAITWTSMNLTGREAPERLTVGQVSSGFFRALSVVPAAGRSFAPRDDEQGADGRLALLSHRLWQSRFNSDPSLVGKTLMLGGQAHMVIGVLPPGTPWLDVADLFVPMVRRPTLDRGSFELTVVGRLAPGVSIDAARADLQRVSRRLAQQFPEDRAMGVTVETSQQWVASDALRRTLWVLVGAVALLLLIACVNIANLLLARATGRMRERAVRTALGATRGRVIQQALIEAGMLGVLGAAAGLGLAFAVVRLLRALDPGGIPRLSEASVDGWVLAATLVATLVTSLVTGLVPALRAPLNDLVAALREGERSVAGSRRTARLRTTLVSAEVALSLILLVGAGLLIRSFTGLLGVERGFHTEDRLLFEVGLPDGRTEREEARAAQILQDLHERILTLPQVTSAAAVSMKPLRGVGTGMGFAAADKPEPPSAAIPWASWRRITRDYFRTLGVPLLQGRDFTPQDVIAKPWRVIISRSVAEMVWPGERAVGRQLILWKGQGQTPAEVIGVVDDMRDWGLANGPSLAVYLPYYGGSSSVVNFVVHGKGAPATLAQAVRGILAQLDPTMPLANVQTLDDLVGQSVASRRFLMLLLASLSGVALVLALAGVYGVVSYTVSQRRGEMGVRMALGASERSVMRLVLRQGMRPVILGLVVGLAGALALSRFMTSLLFGITRGDVPTYAGVAALLAVAALVSCYIPARGALRVDVLAALRNE